MPREKGPEWEYVTLVQPEGTDGEKQGKNKCKLCEHMFHGGATCIRLHFLQVPDCGVAKMRIRRGGSRRRGPEVMGIPGELDYRRRGGRKDMGTEGLSRPPQQFSPTNFTTHSKQPPLAFTILRPFLAFSFLSCLCPNGNHSRLPLWLCFAEHHMFSLFNCRLSGLWEADQVKEKGEATRNEALSSSINSNKTPPITIEADKGDNSANSPVSAALVVAWQSSTDAWLNALLCLPLQHSASPHELVMLGSNRRTRNKVNCVKHGSNYDPSQMEEERTSRQLRCSLHKSRMRRHIGSKRRESHSASK
eukprot:1137557-Pelagomonas_calceolata.AAC.5